MGPQNRMLDMVQVSAGVVKLHHKLWLFFRFYCLTIPSTRLILFFLRRIFGARYFRVFSYNYRARRGSEDSNSHQVRNLTYWLESLMAAKYQGLECSPTDIIEIRNQITQSDIQGLSGYYSVRALERLPRNPGHAITPCNDVTPLNERSLTQGQEANNGTFGQFHDSDMAV